MEACRAKSYGERSHMRFEHGHFFFSELKNINVSIFRVKVTFSGQELVGTHESRKKMACHRWTKELQQERQVLGAMRRL